MPEANQITYSFKELATLMVKEQGLQEGIWGVYVRFGISAANAGPSDSDLKPTALVPVVDIGLQRFEELNNLSVDAAQVNPPSSSAGSKRPSKGAK
jgi:hypothetical protein